MFMRGEGVFGSAELVPMTPKLGQYFGTETGLLVVRAPEDSRLKLEDGDVIVDIDGRTPASPSHALRILSSYQPGEKLKLNVLRTKKRMSFEITMPENAAWEKRFDGAHFERRLERGLERGLRHAPGIEAMPGTPGIRIEGMPDEGPVSAAVAGRARVVYRARPMRRADFAYDLPEDLIAQRPPIERSGSRLLHLERATSRVHDLHFTDLPSLLRAGDLLVFNDTRVIPARVVGSKPTGGQVEILLERVLEGRRILAHAHASKPLRSDVPVALPGGVEAHYIGRRDDLFELELSTDPLPYFEQHGSMPLPPYIERRGGSGRCDALSDGLCARTRRSRRADGGFAFRRSDARALPRDGRELGVRDAARRRRDFSTGARRRSRRSIACMPSASP